MSMITTRPISTSDYAIRNVPLEISPAPSGRLNGRITAKAANDCLGCLSPSSIGKFFAHIYSDCRMFIYSFMSMGRGTTPFEIGARINEMTQFMTVIDSCGDNRNSVNARFQRLSPQVRNLFFASIKITSMNSLETLKSRKNTAKRWSANAKERSAFNVNSAPSILFTGSFQDVIRMQS